MNVRQFRTTSFEQKKNFFLKYGHGFLKYIVTKVTSQYVHSLNIEYKFSEKIAQLGWCTLHHHDCCEIKALRYFVRYSLYCDLAIKILKGTRNKLINILFASELKK